MSSRSKKREGSENEKERRKERRGTLLSFSFFRYVYLLSDEIIHSFTIHSPFFFLSFYGGGTGNEEGEGREKVFGLIRICAPCQASFD